MIDTEKLENFERAFSSGSSGCHYTCHCGKEFFDAANDGYDWAPGELESLMEGDAIGIGHSVGEVRFEGKIFVDACDCWHERARKIMAFTDGHAHEIARYLTLEKQRKIIEADHAPVVG